MLNVVKEKVGNLSLYMCFIFQKIVAMVSWRILWPIMHSLSCIIIETNGYLNHHTLTMWKMCKCMMWQATIRKWIEDKWNACVVRHVNNQTHVARLTKEWKCAHMAFKGTSTISVVNSYLFRWSMKKTCKWKYNSTTRFRKGTCEHTT